MVQDRDCPSGRGSSSDSPWPHSADRLTLSDAALARLRAKATKLKYLPKGALFVPVGRFGKEQHAPPPGHIMVYEKTSTGTTCPCYFAPFPLAANAVVPQPMRLREATQEFEYEDAVLRFADYYEFLLRLC